MAEEMSEKLLATDERFSHSVQVVCEDGCVFFWNNAFMKEHCDWLMVFTEHYGFHLYCIEDLLRYAEYKRVYGQKDER